MVWPAALCCCCLGCCCCYGECVVVDVVDVVDVVVMLCDVLGLEKGLWKCCDDFKIET